MTLEQAREHLSMAKLDGREPRVVYQSHGPAEEGVITSVSDRYVFVRYGSEYGSEYGSRATRADRLAFVSAGAR